ncbi:MAG: hypothetical protein IID44_22630 [Planctomycetes bacterium]|nr:hypothetical protein [Planctomycetota bacterium]
MSNESPVLWRSIMNAAAKKITIEFVAFGIVSVMMMGILAVSISKGPRGLGFAVGFDAIIVLAGVFCGLAGMCVRFHFAGPVLAVLVGGSFAYRLSEAMGYPAGIGQIHGAILACISASISVLAIDLIRGVAQVLGLSHRQVPWSSFAILLIATVALLVWYFQLNCDWRLP